MFEDRNEDRAFTAGTDILLGTTPVTALDAQTPTSVTLSVNGPLSFAGTHVYAFVDSSNAIVETNETNNITASLPCLTNSAACDGARPDLIPSYGRVVWSQVVPPTITQVLVRVGNSGGVIVPAGVTVAFYDRDPALAQRQLIGTTTISTAVSPDSYTDVALNWPAASLALPLWVVVDDNGTTTGAVLESDELNNVYRTALYLSNQPNERPVVTIHTPSTTLTAPHDHADARCYRHR